MAGPSYLHGIEMIDVTVGVRSINVVRSSVVGLVGIAPKGPINTLTLITSPDEAKTIFGGSVPGFTIPKAFEALYFSVSHPVLVVNVFDPALHTSAVSNEAITIANGKVRTAFAPIGALTNFKAAGVSTGAVVNEDYTISEYGDIAVLDAVLLPDGAYTVSYVKLNASAVTSSTIIGSVSDGVRTGMKCWRLAYNMFGFKAKQLLAPGYSDILTVANALKSEAAYYRGQYYIDCTAGTTVAGAITSRGPSGTVAAFNRADKRCRLMYDMPKVFDDYSQADEVRWLSCYQAATRVATDLALGYWYSDSNKDINGITGVERMITWDINDPDGTTEANQLNAVGIGTLVTGFGTGWLSWGNSSSAFPTTTTPDQFNCVLVTRDVTEESVAYAMLPFLDAPILIPQIDSVVETVNTFIGESIGRGALIDGSKCEFVSTDNTDASIGAGKVVFRLTLMSPTPGQRIVFYTALDISLLKNLFKAA